MTFVRIRKVIKDKYPYKAFYKDKPLVIKQWECYLNNWLLCTHSTRNAARYCAKALNDEINLIIENGR